MSKTLKVSYCLSKYVLFASIELTEGQELFFQADTASSAVFFPSKYS